VAITYTLSRVRFKDSEVSTRQLEPKLSFVRITSYFYIYESAPDVTEILEDDYYVTFVGHRYVKRFKKADILYMEYMFEDNVIKEDFIK
jgi:hypothetical protein